MNNPLSSIVRDWLYAAANLTPVNKKVWIFGAWFGQRYSDNSKYLFEYVSAHYPQIRAVWLSRNRSVVEDVRRRGYRAYLFYSPGGLWYAVWAGVAVFCVGYSVDLPGPCMSLKKIYVQLWHGIGPKTVGVLNKKNVIADAKLRPYEGDRFGRYDYMITLSELTRQKTAGMFAVPKNKLGRVLLTGYPRNDALFSHTDPENELSRRIKEMRRDGGKVGVYMPTHRGEGKLVQGTQVWEELAKLNPALRERGLYLLVKLHHFHSQELRDFEASQIILVRDEEIDGDIYPILTMTDFLVTDYSSVYIDYLLLDKPIFFLTPDMAKYQAEEREFYYDYAAVTPGPKVADWSDLIPTIVGELKRDHYRKARSITRKMFHKYSDGHSSQRVARGLLEMLNIF